MSDNQYPQNENVADQDKTEVVPAPVEAFKAGETGQKAEGFTDFDRTHNNAEVASDENDSQQV